MKKQRKKHFHLQSYEWEVNRYIISDVLHEHVRMIQICTYTDNKHFFICWTFMNWMFKCMQKQFNLPFSPASFTLGSVHTLPDLQVLDFIWAHSIFSLLSQKKSTNYFLVWFVVCGPGKQQQLTEEQRMGTWTRGWGRRYCKADCAGLSCQRPSAEGILFCKCQMCVFSSVLAQFNSVFSNYIFFQLLQSWSLCEKKYICTPVINIIMVLRCVSNKGEMWRILPGSSQFSKLFCCFPFIIISQFLFPFSSFKIQ